MSGLRSDIPTEQYVQAIWCVLPKTRIYISDTARLQRVTARGRISEPNAVAFTSCVRTQALVPHDPLLVLIIFSCVRTQALVSRDPLLVQATIIAKSIYSYNSSERKAI